MLALVRRLGWLLCALAAWCHTAHAQVPPPAEGADAPQALEVFDDYSQVEPVPADTRRAVVKRFLADNPAPRTYQPRITTQGYEEDESRPALRLEQIWVGEKAVLLEITGLPRKRSPASAVMRRDTLRIKNTKGEIKPLIAFDGVTELRDKRGGSALVVSPGESMFLLFDRFDDSVSYSLSHVNRDGRESFYFDAIDPRFRERYDAMFAAAVTPLGMKDFLVEFANNDPDQRVMPVFAKLLREMRGLGTFEGHYGAFQLLGEAKDYEAMRRTATTDRHRAVIQAIEDEKQAEARRKEEARLAEERRQEAVRLEQQRLAQARAAEERCMATPSCRQEVEARRAQCVMKINACRRQCDSLTSSSGGGFMGAVVSAVIYRGCASQCKCDNPLGDLFATLDRFEGSAAPARPADTRSSTSSTGNSNSKDTGSKVKPSAPAARTEERKAAVTTAASPKRYVCKIYCISASGPTIQGETAANSRDDAARILGDQADQRCRNAGHVIANPARLPADQCREK